MDFKNSISKKLILTTAIAGSMAVIPFNVFADAVGTVTIGANLNKEQRNMMFNFFGVRENEVEVIEVNNQQERKYLEGVLPDAQIGRKTYSCAYIKPTNKNELNVKTGNINYINGSILKSTIATLSPKNMSFDVAICSPIEASGTGALTGIILSLEQSGEKIDEDKKEIATEELIITGDLSQTIGSDKAVGIINDIKTNIIKENTKDTTQIAQTITNITNNYNVNLSNSQQEQIQELMEKISQQDYNYNELKGALTSIKQGVTDSLKELGEKVNNTTFFEDVSMFFRNIWTGIKGFFANIFSSDENTGININISVLGEDAIISSSEEMTIESSADNRNFFEKIIDWFKNLFSSEKDSAIEEYPNLEADEELNSTEEEQSLELNEDINELEENNQISEDIITEEESFSVDDTINQDEDVLNENTESDTTSNNDVEGVTENDEIQNQDE